MAWIPAQRIEVHIVVGGCRTVLCTSVLCGAPPAQSNCEYFVQIEILDEILDLRRGHFGRVGQREYETEGGEEGVLIETRAPNRQLCTAQRMHKPHVVRT